MNMIEAKVVAERLEANGLSMPLPDRFKKKVTEGQAVTIGVRPIEIKRVAPGATGALEASVEVTEYLGNEALLDLRVGPHELVAEVPADQRVEPGEAIHIALNESAIHLFDTVSGRTLSE
jgi:multiple sugar transport system ATP-binding protein